MPAESQSVTLIEAPTPHQVAERILTLRGAQVLLDRDLAVFFEVKPIRLREQVKRNANRFPPDFMFQLTRSEVDELVSQNAIPSSRHLGGYLPYAFTEEGVAALTAVLRRAGRFLSPMSSMMRRSGLRRRRWRGSWD